MREIVVHEDEVKSCSISNSIVHAGVTSCLTISAVTKDEIIGLHVVQFAEDGTTYMQRLPTLIKSFNQSIKGRPIEKLFFIAPFAFYPEGTEASLKKQIVNAPKPTTIDISQSTQQGNDIYVMGYAKTVQVTAGGNVILRQPW